MTDTIASDNLLTDEQRRTLGVLLNYIIPPDAGRGMPGAGELDLTGYIRDFAPASAASVREELDSLNEESRNQFGADFTELAEVDRQALFDELWKTQGRYGRHIVAQTVTCYYQDDRVLLALGLKPGPPFPDGNDVVSGDLSLLDPVRQRSRLYRE